LWCNRPQKLSSSSATFCHASCLWKHQSFGKLNHCCALPIDLSDAMEALLEFDDSRHRAPLGQLRLSFSTMACAILISPRNQLGESVKRSIGVFIAVFMAWGLWKSLASALLYIDVSVRPSSEALFFFGHLLTRFISSSATRSTSYSN
jgi:hypothetical protein